jgi:hypothetical protein
VTRIPKPPLPQRIATKLRRIASRLQRVSFGRPDYSYVFIITYGRTGSTLLQKLIGSIPGTYVAGENHNALHGAFAAWRDATVLRTKYGWGFQPIDHPWHGALAADPDGYARAMVDGFVRHILKPPRSAKRVGFKEIRYLTDDLAAYLRFIDRFLAPAVFLINTRHIDQVAKSAWWKDVDRDQLAADIARFEAVTDILVAECPDRFIKIDYGDWTTNPESLRPVYAMLGARFDAADVARTLTVQLDHMKTPKS